MNAVQQFTAEMESLILRYGQESDITVGEVIGAIEMIKLNFVLGKLQCDLDDEEPLDLEEGDDDDATLSP